MDHYEKGLCPWDWCYVSEDHSGAAYSESPRRSGNVALVKPLCNNSPIIGNYTLQVIQDVHI